MSSTYTVQNTIDWAKFFLGTRPFTLLGTSEPALTSANIVMQTMLNPPFKWRWNRASIPFPITPAGGDQKIAVPTFGFIEQAYVTDGVGNLNAIPSVQTVAGFDAGTGRPTTIIPLLDDNAGNITFRFLPGTPDQNYTVTVIYQQKPVLLTALSEDWGPIPDEYGMVYNEGFLAMMSLFANGPDMRFSVANQKFIAGLLSLSDGLDEQEMSLFLAQWDYFTRQQSAMAAKTQQGSQGRAV